MQKDLVMQLCQYGLTEKESKVYIALLQLGKATAGTVARFCDEKRSTVYAVLGALHSKWYVEEMQTKAAAQYISKPPQEILQKAKEKIDILEILVPMLQNLEGKIGNKPSIRYLEGMDWLRELFEDFLTTEVDMKVIFGTHNTFDSVHLPFAAKVRDMRIKKWIFSKRIVTNTTADKKTEIAQDKRYNRKTLIVDDFPGELKADINIYGPWKVSLHFFDERQQPHSVLIQSMPLYESLQTLFDYIWLSHMKPRKNLSTKSDNR